MSERWKPEVGEQYWIVAFNETVQSVWRADNADFARWRMGNCFKTKEKAVTALEKFTALLLSLHEPTTNSSQPVTNCNQLPDWCKVGQWVYLSNAKYYKIEEIRFDGGLILSDGVFLANRDIHAEAVSAHLRPYNSEELKALVGNTIEYDSHVCLVIGYNGNKNTIFIGNGSELCAQTLMSYYNVNGKPAGVFEHIENGEWVE